MKKQPRSRTNQRRTIHAEQRDNVTPFPGNPTLAAGARRLLDRIENEHIEDKKRNEAAYARARAEPLYACMKLIGDRVLCARPHREVAATLTRYGSMLYKADRSARTGDHAEYLYVTQVLLVGSGVPDDVVAPGDFLLVPQFAGHPVYDCVRGYETELWVFGFSSSVIALYEPDNEVDLASTRNKFRVDANIEDANPFGQASSNDAAGDDDDAHDNTRLD